MSKKKHHQLPIPRPLTKKISLSEEFLQRLKENDRLKKEKEALLIFEKEKQSLQNEYNLLYSTGELFSLPPEKIIALNEKLIVFSIPSDLDLSSVSDFLGGKIDALSREIEKIRQCTLSRRQISDVEDEAILSIMNSYDSTNPIQKIINECARMGEIAAKKIIIKLYSSKVIDLNLEQKDMTYLPAFDLLLDGIPYDVKACIHFFSGVKTPFSKDKNENTIFIIVRPTISKNGEVRSAKIELIGLSRPGDETKTVLSNLDLDTLPLDWVLSPTQAALTLRDKISSSPFLSKFKGYSTQSLKLMAELGILSPSEAILLLPNYTNTFAQLIKHNPNLSLMNLRRLLFDHALSKARHGDIDFFDHFVSSLKLTGATDYQIKWSRGVVEAISKTSCHFCFKCNSSFRSARIKVRENSGRYIVQFLCNCGHATTILAYCRKCCHDLIYSRQNLCKCGGLICSHDNTCRHGCSHPRPAFSEIYF